MDVVKIDCSPSNLEEFQCSVKYKIPADWGALKLSPRKRKIEAETYKIDNIIDLSYDVCDTRSESDLEASFDSADCDTSLRSNYEITSFEELDPIANLQSVEKNDGALIDKFTRLEGKNEDYNVIVSRNTEIDSLEKSGPVVNLESLQLDDGLNDEILIENIVDEVELCLKRNNLEVNVQDEFIKSMKSKSVYTPALRKTVLEHCVKIGPIAAARKFGIGKQVVLEWKRKAGIVCPVSFKGKPTPKIMYDKKFKEEVLKHYDNFGRADTCRKFGINSDRIYEWRQQLKKDEKKINSNKRRKHKIFSKEFIQQALDSSVTKGFFQTLKEFHLSARTLSRLKREAGKLREKRCYSDDYKREVVKYYMEHGIASTLAKYQNFDGSYLCKWRKKFQSEYGCPPIPVKLQESRKFRSEVVKFSREKGLKAATEKFNLSIPKIWDMRSKERRKERRLNKEVRKKRPCTNVEERYDVELKNEVVSQYLENGGIYCERKFKVPRQTVRGWAVQMGKAEVGYVNVKYRAEVLELARKEGVKKALQMYPVPRATLYYWAKLCGGEISERSNHCLQMIVNQQGLKRRVVFRRAAKPKKVKVKKVKKVKVKKEKPKIVEVPREILPTWAEDFIKPTKKPNYGITLPTVISSTSSPLVQDSNSLHYVINLTLPVSEVPLTHSGLTSHNADSSSESEYECDDDSDLLFPLPFFSPNTEDFDKSLTTVDPPGTIRRSQRRQAVRHGS